MQELINRTGGIAESLFTAAVDAAYLASYLGLSYIALSMAAASLHRLWPAREFVGSSKQSR
ncbi:MAG TPA: hypothetical protein VG897_15605 [Terriglobales bacterium]|nr:hypothetical protein [Terriglobales bacterium]